MFQRMTVTIILVGVIILLSGVYAKYYDMESGVFGETIMDKVKIFVEDLAEGADPTVGESHCTGCGYTGTDRNFVRYQGLILCCVCGPAPK